MADKGNAVKDIRWINSRLAQTNNVQPDWIAHVQRVLKKPHVLKPGEKLMVVVSYELDDELVNDQVRAQAVAKIIRLVKRRLDIKRLDADEVARVKTFLQSEAGKAWLQEKFAPAAASSKGKISNDPDADVLTGGKPPPTSDRPSGKQARSVGGPRITERLFAAIPGMPKTRTKLAANAEASSSEAERVMATKKSAKAPQQSSKGSGRPQSPTEALIGTLICLECKGTRCGRGLTCTRPSAPTTDAPGPAATGDTLRVQGVLNGPNQPWKQALLTTLFAVFVYILGNWVFGSQGLRISMLN